MAGNKNSGGPGGRKPGSKNKLPREAKAYVVAVAEQLEKEGLGLLQWAKANPDDFWGKMYKAVVPREVEGKLDGEITVHVVTGIDRGPND